MVEVLKNVYSIDLSQGGDHSLESWVLNCDEGLVVIDTGMSEDAIGKIGAEIHSIGKKWEDVKLVLITHKHGDHIKNLPKIMELTETPVKAHKFEAPLIRDAVGVEVEGLKDKEEVEMCGGIEVVHVPGHSEGNCCYYLRRHRAMIAGDTIFGDTDGNLFNPPERYCLDAKQAAQNIRRLLNYDFDYLLITHGKDVMKEGKKMVRKLVEINSKKS